MFKHDTEKQYLSVHIDDIILVAEEACHYLFVEHFSNKLKLKAAGPYGVEKPGTLYYLKRRITFDNEGLEIAANKKHVPKLSSLLGVQERRQRSPTHGSLDIYDASATPEEEFLNAHFVLGSLCPYERDSLFGFQHAENENAAGKVQMCLERSEERAGIAKTGEPFSLG